MTIELRQSAGNATARNGKSVKVTFSEATRQGSLIVVVASARSDHDHLWDKTPSGFTTAKKVFDQDAGVAIWFRQNAPSLTSVTVDEPDHRSMIVRIHELTGVAQSNALDRTASAFGDDTYPKSGSTGTTTQADEVIFAAITNEYASTTQYGFTGGLGRISETVSPSSSDGVSDTDDERHRLTVHAALASTTGSYALTGRLSTRRDWAGAIVTFRGGSSGPARLTSKTQPAAIRLTGRARLTAFGPMRSKTRPAAIVLGGRAWIGPFENQFLIGGRDGLLIGKSTAYRVESVEGIGGWNLRSSDTPFPRDDGDQRGVDLQEARQILFRVNFNDAPVPMEAAMQRLLKALRPQRDTDWELIFRLPGMPLQALRCRPLNLSRELNLQQMLLRSQAFALRAADPRIYSARFREVVVPVSTESGGVITVTSVPNVGNADAYPIIQVTGSPTEDVTGLELVNTTGNIAFGFSGVLPAGGTLIADMPATVTSEPRSKVTVDGQPKYGSWVAPREPFFLAPDPDAPGGVNALYLRTTPPNAAVTCTLRYRDTWAG